MFGFLVVCVILVGLCFGFSYIHLDFLFSCGLGAIGLIGGFGIRYVGFWGFVMSF